MTSQPHKKFITHTWGKRHHYDFVKIIKFPVKESQKIPRQTEYKCMCMYKYVYENNYYEDV